MEFYPITTMIHFLEKQFFFNFVAVYVQPHIALTCSQLWNTWQDNATMLLITKTLFLMIALQVLIKVDKRHSWKVFIKI